MNGVGVDAETMELSRGFPVTLRSTMLALFLSVALPWFSPSFAQDKPSGKSSVRACPDSWNDGVRRGKKSPPARKKKIAPKQSGACIELAFSPLDIQEYLQSYARQKHWLISDDQLNEDSWTFSLDIDHDELLRDTLPDASQKGVEWKQGAVRVHINTLLLPDGFARTGHLREFPWIRPEHRSIRRAKGILGLGIQQCFRKLASFHASRTFFAASRERNALRTTSSLKPVYLNRRP
jgi:hypothetical protein